MKNNKYISISLLALFLPLVIMYTSCKRHHDFSDVAGKIGNCSDGIKNQNEESIDCGGVCAACANCTDGIKNGSETGVDCGGTSCVSCNPPSTPNNCSTLNNQSIINMGGSSTAAVYSAYKNVTDSNNIHIDLNTNFNSISSYDIYLGSNNFSSMAVGAQEVYTLVDPNIVSALQGGQASITITQGGFSFAQYYGRAGESVYFKKISTTLMQVWFCGIYTTDVPANGYYYSVSAKF